MHGMLTTLARGFEKRIGWKRVGVAASVLIILFAVTTLVRTLRDVDTGVILTALTCCGLNSVSAVKITPVSTSLVRTLRDVDTGVILTALTELRPQHVGLAALCVVGAFCTLTFYDFFALRTIGKNQVPYRIAALSSFTSYTIGHNIGATVFTGGAIRFRIYSDYGLNAIDVAKICFLSGLTFWLGNLFVLGIGMAWHPAAASAIYLLPPQLNRLIALGCLAGIAAYLTWIFTGKGRRQLGQHGWKVFLPSAPLTLLQILIGVVDLGFCALAFYLLMPVHPDIDFVSVAVVFILATLLGFASHAPGSLGVFDAAMRVALPQFGREHLVATLLLYRMLYFVIPFGLAISIMGARELWMNVVEPWQERRRLAEACAQANLPNQVTPMERE